MEFCSKNNNHPRKDFPQMSFRYKFLWNDYNLLVRKKKGKWKPLLKRVGKPEREVLMPRDNSRTVYRKKTTLSIPGKDSLWQELSQGKTRDSLLTLVLSTSFFSL